MSAPEPRAELFDDLAAQLEAMDQPLSLAWMQSRNVSLEELQAVSQKAALILRGYLALSPTQRIAFVSLGIFAPNSEPTKNQPAETILGERNALARNHETTTE